MTSDQLFSFVIHPADRAEKAVNELVLPHIRTAALEGRKNVHIALVSHGLCISKLVERLLLKDSETPQSGDFRGLLNTAWTRLEVKVRVCTIAASLSYPIADSTFVNTMGNIGSERGREDSPC